MNAVAVIDELKRRFPNEPEYIQAVEEVLTSIEDVYNEILNLNVITSSSVFASPTVFSHSVFRGLMTRVRFTITWVTVCSTTMPSALTRVASVSTRR